MVILQPIKTERMNVANVFSDRPQLNPFDTSVAIKHTKGYIYAPIKNINNYIYSSNHQWPHAHTSLMLGWTLSTAATRGRTSTWPLLCGTCLALFTGIWLEFLANWQLLCPNLGAASCGGCTWRLSQTGRSQFEDSFKCVRWTRWILPGQAYPKIEHCSLFFLLQKRGWSYFKWLRMCTDALAMSIWCRAQIAALSNHTLPFFCLTDATKVFPQKQVNQFTFHSFSSVPSGIMLISASSKSLPHDVTDVKCSSSEPACVVTVLLISFCSDANPPLLLLHLTPEEAEGWRRCEGREMKRVEPTCQIFFFLNTENRSILQYSASGVSVKKQMARETCFQPTHIGNKFHFIYSHESVIHQETAGYGGYIFLSSRSFTIGLNNI